MPRENGIHYLRNYRFFVANDAGEEFGPERLTTLVGGPEQEAMEQRYGAIMDEVRTHAAGKFTDDATLVLLSVNDAVPPPPSRSTPQMRTSA